MKKHIQVILISIILLVALGTYSNHFNNGFHFDDSHTIVQNEYIRDIKNIPLFFKDARTFSSLPSNQSYRPGLTTLNTIDVLLGGSETPQPFAFHLSIFICHLLSGILLYLVVLNLLSQTIKNRWTYVISLFISAWFLIHTANAETINYIIARSDSFSTCMILLAFTLYLYSVAARRTYLYLIPVIIGFSVKEHAIMFVPILFVYRFLFEEEASFELKKHGKELLVTVRKMIIPFITCIALGILLKVMTPQTWTPGGLNRWSYLFTQFFVFVHYVYNFFLPLNLVVDTDWKVVPSLYDDKVFAGLLFTASLGYAAFKAAQTKSYKGVAFGICWFFIALLPTSSIVPFAEVLNDHRTFFPYIGLFIVVATILHNLVLSPGFANYKPAPAIFYTIALVVLGLHAYGTYQRNIVWHTEESLWEDATVKAPGNSKAWMNYGITLMAKGNYREAENCFLKTKELAPFYSYVYINLAIVKQATGRISEAELDFKQALALDSNVPEAYSFYGKFLLAEGRSAEAKQMIEKGLAISPAHQLLKALQVQSSTASFVVMSKQAENISAKKTTPEVPKAADYLNLSLRYYNSGKYDSCIVAAKEALKADPRYDLAYNNICAAYNQLKNWSKAIEAGEEGLKINPGNKLLQGNLNESYKERDKNSASIKPLQAKTN